MQFFLAAVTVFLFVLLVLGAVRNVMGWGIRREYTPAVCITASATILLGLLLLVLAVANGVWHVNVLERWHLEFEKSLQQTVAMYHSLGMEQAEINRAARWIRILFFQGAPGWAVVLAAGISALGYGLERKQRLRSSSGGGTGQPLSLWQTPEWLIWFLIASLLGIVLGSHGLAWAGWLGLNGAIVTGSIYFMLGYAVVRYFLEKRGQARVWLLLSIVVIFFFPAMSVLIALVGILDTWWDWRKLRAQLPGN